MANSDIVRVKYNDPTHRYSDPGLMYNGLFVRIAYPRGRTNLLTEEGKTGLGTEIKRTGLVTRTKVDGKTQIDLTTRL